MFLLQFSPAFGKRPCGSVKNWTLFSDPLVIKSKFTLIYFLSYKQTECTSSRLFVALVIGWCFPRNNLIGLCNNISLIWLAKCSPEPESSVWLEQWSSPITTKWWTKKTEKVLKLSMVSIRRSGRNQIRSDQKLDLDLRQFTNHVREKKNWGLLTCTSRICRDQEGAETVRATPYLVSTIKLFLSLCQLNCARFFFNAMISYDTVGVDSFRRMADYYNSWRGGGTPQSFWLGLYGPVNLEILPVQTKICALNI